MTATVGANVERVVGVATRIFLMNDLEPRTHAGELIFDGFCIHN
jgi:hypothetical protein